jgi:uncharacterized NAD(P)/FAD-binding protein YdhS
LNASTLSSSPWAIRLRPRRAGIDPATRRDPRYHADPWRFQAGMDEEDDKPILLIGSGLTMVDVALSLTRAAPGRRIIALSRRGLISPRPCADVAHRTTARPRPRPRRRFCCDG